MAGCCSTPIDCNIATGGRQVEWFKLGLAVLVAAQNMTIGLALNLSPPPEAIDRWLVHGLMCALTLVVFVLCGFPLLKEAIRQALARRIVMEQFFLTGIIAAWAISIYATIENHSTVYYEVVSVLLAIYTLGTMISQRKRSQALQAANSLRQEFETCIKLSCCGKTLSVRVSKIQKDDRVLIQAGGAVPVDGIIQEGVAFISETPITGEAFPVVRRAGDKVLAGSHVLDQAITVKATAAGTERHLDRLLQQVEQARQRPSSLQREADRIVSWFLPTVLIIAVLTFIGWTLVKGWEIGLLNSLAVLVVACPCAMGLATPICIWSALAALGGRGIAAGSGDWIEQVAQVNTVVFDKTGTLSEEELSLVDFVCLNDRETLREKIAAVQKLHSHPVARAFAGWESSFHARDEKLIAGIGLQATVTRQDGGEDLIQIGNKNLLLSEDREPEATLLTQLKPDTTFSHTIYIKKNEKLVALAILRERLRDSVNETLHALEANHLQVEFMTGDRPESVAHLPWKHVHCSLLPEQKTERVIQLQKSGRKVFFIGDGINDSAAMSHSHVSLAMSSGAQLTQESAKAVLYGGDLRAVFYALQICRKAVNAIRLNLLFAAGYNFVGIGLAAAGILHPVVAALLMLVSSLTVSWNALRMGHSWRTAENLNLPKPPIELPQISEIPFKPFFEATYQHKTAVLIGVTIGLQGVLVGWMGALTGAMYAVVCVCWMIAGCILTQRLANAPSQRNFFWSSMLSLGVFGMLIGWTIDAGTAPVIRDGVCLCGCQKSNLGHGLVARFSWMDVGMLLASLLTFFIIRPTELEQKYRRHLAWSLYIITCLLGMFAGMQFTARGMSFLPIMHPRGQFFLTFISMVIGMSLGMMATCRLYCYLPLPKSWRANFDQGT